MPRYNSIDPSQIPEVMAFEEAQQMLDVFKDKHSHIFQEYDELIQARNIKLEAADKVVRAKKVSCGDWELYQRQKTFDADALYEALGRDQFLAVGGVLQTVTNRSIDKAKLEASIARGDIPKKVLDVVVSESPRYHAPKAIT
jgi:hypothetical protein